MTSVKTVSIIIPCYNEQENIYRVYQEITKVWQDQKVSENLKIIFINDGSVDKTEAEIQKLTSKDSRVGFLSFTRNFGKEVATTAGINNTKADAAIIFDADGQYPAKKIPEFIKAWRDGASMVVGVRDKKKTKDLLEKIGSSLFYKIIELISETKVLDGALDFRLLDKRVIRAFKGLTERDRMTRALLDWMGFETTYIKYTERPRQAGKTSFSFKTRFKLASYTLARHSTLPLRVAGLLGVGIILISGPLGFYALINQFILDSPFSASFSGPFLLGILNTFMIGVVLMSLGLISLYIGNIHTEVINRPIYIVNKKKNCD